MVSCFGLNWLTYEEERMGLWHSCNQQGCSVMKYTPSYFVPFLDWYSAVRSFVVLSIIFVLLAMMAAALNMYAPKHFTMKPVRLCILLNVLFLVLGVVVFGAEQRTIFDGLWSLDWTYYFTCFGLVLTILVYVYYHFIEERKDLRRSMQMETLKAPPSYKEKKVETNYQPATNDVTSFPIDSEINMTSFQPEKKSSSDERVDIDEESERSRSESQRSSMEKKQDEYDDDYSSFTSGSRSGSYTSYDSEEEQKEFL